MVLNRDEMDLVTCAAQDHIENVNEFATCAGKLILGRQLTDGQRQEINCAEKAISSDDHESIFLKCIQDNLDNVGVTPQQAVLLHCAVDSDDDAGEFATCAGKALIGDRLTPAEQTAISCAYQSEGDAGEFATCAANEILKSNLNPEQSIALECVVETGGEPDSATVCTAGRLTVRELEKCATDGFGGKHGCFGDDNDLVGKNGWLMKHIPQPVTIVAGNLSAAPRESGALPQIIRATTGISVGDIRKYGIFGGPNSLFRKPFG